MKRFSQDIITVIGATASALALFLSALLIGAPIAVVATLAAVLAAMRWQRPTALAAFAAAMACAGVGLVRPAALIPAALLFGVGLYLAYEPTPPTDATPAP